MGAPHLTQSLSEKVADGSTLLIAYLMAGSDDNWLDTVEAVIEAGADAVEIGLPFSDPIIDGAVIQAAGVKSLERGTTAIGALAQLARRDFSVPLVAMTYYNVIAHLGHERFAGAAVDAGISGAIVPDLSLEELGPWADVADSSGIDTVLLVAPSTPPERTALLCERSRGFVYAVARMGVTGEQSVLGNEAGEVVAKIREHRSPPVCVGIGVSTPDQAVQVASVADGVIVGSALVRRLLEGEGPEGAGRFIASLRQAIDASS